METTQVNPPGLPVGYYLDNFLAILDFIDSQYDDILNHDERSFSRSFRSLSLDARRLYVRLVTRKGPLFRSDTLRYDEIGDDAQEPGLRRMRDNLLNSAARQLERAGDDEAALTLYRQAVLPPSRERQVRILERRRETEEAHRLCRGMLEDPWDEAESEFAERYSRRLARALGQQTAAAIEPTLPTETVVLARAGEMSVEEAALRYFQSSGWTGYHTGNILWTGLFGLAFWDIVFLSLPGAFFNRYQRGPRDLFSPEFRRRRDAPIRERLQKNQKRLMSHFIRAGIPFRIVGVLWRE